jgi:predicted DNA-binding protein YlxM (UPF0122 family)
MSLNITKEYLVEQYTNKNLSSTKIAYKFGVTRQAILYYLKKYKITIKNPSERVKGNNNYNFGKKGEVASGYKTGVYCKKHYCIDCHKSLKSVYAIRCQKCNSKQCKTLFKIGHEFSEETKRKISLATGGTGIPRENSKYGKEFVAKLKYRIYKRDNFTCQNCNQYGTVGKNCLTAHHIDYNKKNCVDTNLITLCKKCNGKANFNREFWQDFYTNKIINKA